MPLRTRPLRAVIFDMDGTLVDSERVIMRAWLSAAQQAGRPIDPEFYVKVIGLNVEESDRVLLDHLGSTVLLETIRQTVSRQLAAHGESVNRDPLGLKRGDLAADEAVRRSRVSVDQIADSQVSAP